MRRNPLSSVCALTCLNCASLSDACNRPHASVQFTQLEALERLEHNENKHSCDGNDYNCNSQTVSNRIT
eukprot:4161138-Amphidinium_carterae.1